MTPKRPYLLVILLVMGTMIIFHHTPEAALLGLGAFALGYLVKGKRGKNQLRD